MSSSEIKIKLFIKRRWVKVMSMAGKLSNETMLNFIQTLRLLPKALPSRHILFCFKILSKNGKERVNPNYYLHKKVDEAYLRVNTCLQTF